MPGPRLPVLLSFGAVLGPWLVAQPVRERHGLACAVFSVALAVLATTLKPRIRAEQATQPVLMALTWPPALIAAVTGNTGIGRSGLAACGACLLLVALCTRLLVTSRTVPAGGRRTTKLLQRSFPELAPLVRVELALLWFGLFRWRRRLSDAPADALLFPGTATGMEPAMCFLTAAGFVIETPLLHVLLAHVSGETVAIGCTVLHVILGIYLVGYAKSLLFRPTLLFEDRLEIRLGVVARRVVPRGAIEAVVLHGERRTAREGEQRLFGLDEPNLRLVANGTSILFRVDAPDALMRALAA